MGMLILSRHREESIIIGNNIKVMVVGICGDKVRLGIEAPENISVHRQEIYEANQRAKGMMEGKKKDRPWWEDTRER